MTPIILTVFALIEFASKTSASAADPEPVAASLAEYQEPVADRRNGAMQLLREDLPEEVLARRLAEAAADGGKGFFQYMRAFSTNPRTGYSHDTLFSENFEWPETGFR